MATSLKLNEIEIGINTPVSTVDSAMKGQKAKEVKFLGLIAFGLSIIGLFVPLIGLLMLAGAWLLSRSALKTASDFLVSDQDDKFARWANTVSKVFLVLNAIGLVMFILSL